MRSVIFLNPNQSGNALSRPVFTSLLICLLLIVTMASCKKDKEVILLPEADQFVPMAKDFTQNANLPVSIEEVLTEGEITSLQASAREIIDEMVFIKTDADGTVNYNKVKEGNELSETQKEEAAQGLIDNQLLEKGDFIFRANWKKPNGEAFYTLGVIDAGGKPKFEPILHFNGILFEDAPHPMHRGWDWTFSRRVTNGFGMTCISVDWKVHIATSPDNCQIVDPAPHIEITKAESNCWGWKQETTKGELYWCNPREECECRYGATFPAEECIKFIVITYVVSGFSDVEIQAGGGVQYKGFNLDAKIKMTSSNWGYEGTYETIRSICASGSTP